MAKSVRFKAAVGVLTSVMTSIIVSCAPGKQGAQVGAASPIDPLSTNPSTSQVAPPQHLGTVDGGGGRVVICLDPQTQTKTVELLDLYEAEHIYQRKLMSLKAESVHVAFVEFAQKFSLRGASTEEDENVNADRTDGDKIDYEHVQSKKDLVRYRNRFGLPTTRLQELDDAFSFEDQFYSKAKFVSGSTRLKPIDDSHEIVSDANCQSVQIVNYQTDQTILVQKDLWKLMSDRDRAALIAHEYIYKLYRALGAKTSVEARKINGIIFSSSLALSVLETDSAASLKCLSDPIDGKQMGSSQIGMTIEIPKDHFTKPRVRLFSYWDQVLIAPLVSEWGTDSENNGFFFNDQNSLAECKAHEHDKKQWTGLDLKDSGDSLEFSTPYFHDIYAVNYRLRCGLKKNSKEPGSFELTLTTKKVSSGQVTVFRCSNLESVPTAAFSIQN